jgi:hypothetical protein
MGFFDDTRVSQNFIELVGPRRNVWPDFRTAHTTRLGSVRNITTPLLTFWKR